VRVAAAVVVLAVVVAAAETTQIQFLRFVDRLPSPGFRSSHGLQRSTITTRQTP